MQVRFKDDSVFLVPNGRWQEILGIKPIRTHYTEDKRFISRYYNLADSLVGTSKGTWRLDQDSLYWVVDGQATVYAFSREGSIGSFVGHLDWDQDGKVEELYEGMQEKLSGN